MHKNAKNPAESALFSMFLGPFLLLCIQIGLFSITSFSAKRIYVTVNADNWSLRTITSYCAQLS